MQVHKCAITLLHTQGNNILLLDFFQCVPTPTSTFLCYKLTCKNGIFYYKDEFKKIKISEDLSTELAITYDISYNGKRGEEIQNDLGAP